MDTNIVNNDTATEPTANGVDPATLTANPPNNPNHQVLPDNHPLKVALDAQKNKNTELMQELAQMKQQLAMVTGHLGQIDPSRLSEIQDAVKAQSQAEQREAAIRKAAIEETETRFSQNLSTLTASLNDSQTQLKQIQQRNSLQGLFAQCGGKDFESFSALINSKYLVEYAESADPFSPPKIERILNKVDRSPVTDESGSVLQPNQILSLLRQGKLGGDFGKIVSGTFLPWNQANGNGYSPSMGMGPGMAETNPFLDKNWNMTKIGQLYKVSPTEAIRLANESGNPKAIALAKNWSGK